MKCKERYPRPCVQVNGSKVRANGSLTRLVTPPEGTKEPPAFSVILNAEQGANLTLPPDLTGRSGHLGSGNEELACALSEGRCRRNSDRIRPHSCGNFRRHHRSRERTWKQIERQI